MIQANTELIIPEGWICLQFKDIFERVMTRNIEDNQNVLTISAKNGLVNQKDYFKKSVASKTLTNYFLLHKGEFAYNRSFSIGNPMGVIKRLDDYDKGILSTLYICFKLVNLNISSDYILEYFSLKQFEIELSKILKEGARNHGILYFNIADILALKFIIPPLHEQNKISNILRSIDKKISSTEIQINEMNIFKKALMSKVLTEGIGHTKFKNSLIGNIPIEWEVQRIEEISEIKGGKRIPKGSSLTEEKTKFPYIRVTDMFMGSINLEKIMYVPEDIQEKIKNYTISKEDLFISVAGTLGTVGIVPDSLDKANLTENANKLTNIKINKKFLLYVLMSELVQLEIKKQTTSNAQPKLAMAKIKAFNIPIPLDKEQEKIVEIFSKVDEKLEILRKKKESFEELKKGLKQKLLTGELRV